MNNNEALPELAELPLETLVASYGSANVAVIDSAGTIVAVNDNWLRFASENNIQRSNHCVGDNYFAAAEAAVDPLAREAVAGIKDVLKGNRETFYLEYPCHSPEQQRWFSLSAAAIPSEQGFAVLVHRERDHQPDTRIESPPSIPVNLPTVLLIDDDEMILDATATLLDPCCGKLYPCISGEDAMAHVAAGITPDLIISDYRMPGDNGVTVVRRVRETLKKTIPAVIMTGDTSAREIAAAKLPDCEILSKPSGNDALLNIIDELTH